MNTIRSGTFRRVMTVIVLILLVSAVLGYYWIRDLQQEAQPDPGGNLETDFKISQHNCKNDMSTAQIIMRIRNTGDRAIDISDMYILVWQNGKRIHNLSRVQISLDPDSLSDGIRILNHTHYNSFQRPNHLSWYLVNMSEQHKARFEQGKEYTIGIKAVTYHGEYMRNVTCSA